MTVPESSSADPGTAGAAKAARTGDPAVDALVALAGQTEDLPAGEHKAVYSRIIEGLERELDADPAAGLLNTAAQSTDVP